jgi:catechol 2,3-dioxygenase-like lactoylglutathione lyase family enzyme
VTEWQKEIGAITLFVEDLDRSKAFYQDVFGLPALNEDADGVMFRFANTLVFLTKSAAAPRLIGPAHVGTPEAGPRSLMAIIVHDVDAVCAELDKKGVALLNGPADRAWGMRTAAFIDPGGHVWEIAQELPSTENS